MLSSKRYVRSAWVGILVSAAFTFQQTAALTVTDLSNPAVTPQALVDALLAQNSGAQISNVVYTGADVAGGIFTEGSTGGLDIAQGIILSSGDIAYAADNDNDVDSSAGFNFTAGDTDLDALVTNPTTDAAVLEFDFVPTGDKLTFNYIFASEEYLEYVGSPFNDVFGYFLDGQNLALVPGSNDIVSINSINDQVNSTFYRDNPFNTGTYPIEFDGFTGILTVETTVTPGQAHHIKLAIADVFDNNYDSAIFISGFSAAQQFNLGVSLNGSGSVVSAPAGIDCGATCSQSYPADTAVTLTPTPAAGWQFVAWSGDPDCADGSVMMDADKQCVATFAQLQPVTLSIIPPPPGVGRIVSEPAGIDCGTVCSAQFPANTAVAFSFELVPDVVFSGWSGNCGGSTSEPTVQLDSNLQCVALFSTSSGQPIVAQQSRDIPTLSEWMMIALGLILFGLGRHRLKIES